jgi:16S rRNA G966 N2-methylase RsmD
MEAWSRGYDPVTCVEQARESLGIIQANARGTEVRILRRDVRKLGAREFSGLAVLFADPPYELGAGLWEEMKVRMAPWMAPEGVLAWETDCRTELGGGGGWTALETRDYGTVRFHFFRPGTP